MADRLIDLTRELYDAYRAFMDEWLETWESYSVEVKDLSRQVLTFRDEKVVRFAIFLDRADAERAAGLHD